MRIVATHKRKAVAFAVLLVIALAVGGVTSLGYLKAQEGRYSHIYTTKSGDDEVVTVVNGTEVTRGQIRKMPARLRENQPNLNLTEDEAIKLSIGGQIDRFVLLSEVNRRGLMPTFEEARQFMEPHKQACLGPHGADCRAGISEDGESLDGYWDKVLPRYQEDLGMIRLVQAHFAESALTHENTNADLLSAKAAFVDGLRAKATIDWKDQKLAKLYQEALSPAGKKFKREKYEKAKSK